MADNATARKSAGDLKFDAVEAARFGALLDPSSPDGPFTFVALDDNKSRKDGRLTRTMKMRLSEAAAPLQPLNQRGAGIFVAINKLRRGGNRRADNVIGLRAVWIDLDGAPLDPVWNWKLPPHIVVESSPGKFHAYWRVDGSVPLTRFGELQRKLASEFNSDATVCDLPRIMRLPGAWHQKAKPFKTRIIYPTATEGAGR